MEITLAGHAVWGRRMCERNVACLNRACSDAESQSVTFDLEVIDFNNNWVSNAIPKTSSGSLDNCRRFVQNVSYIPSSNDFCPATMFDQQIITECEEYIYENRNTVVYDFGLACNEWGRTSISTMSALATFISLPLTGFISDRWGRKTAFTITVFSSSVFGLARYWCTSYHIFIILGFASTIFNGGYYPTAFILGTELVGSKYRVFIGLLLNIGLALGEIVLGLVAWAVPHWRNLTLLAYIPTLTIVLFWVAYTNPVRWYISKGLYKEAENTLINIARVNKKHLSDNLITILKRAREEQMKKEGLEREERKKEPWLVVQVWQHKPVLIRCLVSPVWWITFTFIYYALAINSVGILGIRQPIHNVYIAVAVIDIPGHIIGYLLLHKVGRKPVLSGGFFVCAASQISYLFVPNVMIITTYVYTSELYPTRYRQSLVALSSMIGRIGSTVSHITPALGDQLPYILYACLATIAGTLVFITPETFGSKYTDTMEEASELGSIFHKSKRQESDN
ncbi:solute carrier family 22 member 16-like isoform X2 [Pectinophora gossypiella]|uniref:solute carrier family 22 member 16-like isoform X2 n=1 Tax=Pectinophora gossypiella TaxID=13191 RepID=UPI00214EB828|nr:solute carrier family 22 member 16-like isoform X2 [Pectinophora gossypiella]